MHGSCRELLETFFLGRTLDQRLNGSPTTLPIISTPDNDVKKSRQITTFNVENQHSRWT